MEIEDALGFEKFKKVGFYDDAEGSENAESVGVFVFQAGDFGEVFAGAGMKKNVGFRFAVFVVGGEDGFRKVSERTVAEKNDFWARCLGDLSVSLRN